MKAFFFGPPCSPLLGVYHAAKASCDRYQGVVFCYPFGQEYMRAHRAFRQLAESLSLKGFHVLRFDYRGTGDSGGDLNDITAADWLRDIEYAVQELKDMTGVPNISLMGLRLGGLLAGVAGAQRRDLGSLVLWDPVITGEDFTEQVKQRVAESPARKRRSNFIDSASGTVHLNGFFLPPKLQRSLEELSLLAVKPLCRRILQVASHEIQAFAELASTWRNIKGFRYQHVPAEHDWCYVDHVGGILIPQPVLREIAEWI